MDGVVVLSRLLTPTIPFLGRVVRWQFPIYRRQDYVSDEALQTAAARNAGGIPGRRCLRTVGTETPLELGYTETLLGLIARYLTPTIERPSPTDRSLGPPGLLSGWAPSDLGD